MPVGGKSKAIPLDAWAEPSGLREVEITRISRHSAFEGGKVVRINSCYSFLLVADATLRPECGQTD